MRQAQQTSLARFACVYINFKGEMKCARRSRRTKCARRSKRDSPISFPFNNNVKENEMRQTQQTHLAPRIARNKTSLRQISAQNRAPENLPKSYQRSGQRISKPPQNTSAPRMARPNFYWAEMGASKLRQRLARRMLKTRMAVTFVAKSRLGQMSVIRKTSIKQT